MLVNALRSTYWLAIILMFYLALTPSDWGLVIESGEQRHWIAFTVLPVLSAVAWPRIRPLAQFVWYAIIGAAVEGLQAWMGVGREAALDDFLLDCLATAVALSIVGLVRMALGIRQARTDP